MLVLVQFSRSRHILYKDRHTRLQIGIFERHSVCNNVHPAFHCGRSELEGSCARSTGSSRENLRLLRCYWFSYWNDLKWTTRICTSTGPKSASQNEHERIWCRTSSKTVCVTWYRSNSALWPRRNASRSSADISCSLLQPLILQIYTFLIFLIFWYWCGEVWDAFLRLFESRSKSLWTVTLQEPTVFLAAPWPTSTWIFMVPWFLMGSTVGKGCDWETMGKDFPYRSMTFESKPFFNIKHLVWDIDKGCFKSCFAEF